MTNWSEPIESPLENYPGSVRFPWPFTLKYYKVYVKANQERLANDDRFKVIVLTADEKNIVYNSDDWCSVLALVDLDQLQNLPADCLTDKSGDSTPYELTNWLIPLFVDYINEQFDPKKLPPPPGTPES